ncbi:MAG: hypothetical protein OXH79_09180 [Boseongicola sp.]|nr:hypothetical protein [Boseongicola sp.]
MSESEYHPLEKAVFLNAGHKGLAIRLQTAASRDDGVSYVLGFLLPDERKGRKFLQELANAVEAKWSTKH